MSLDVFLQSLALFLPILAANQAGKVARVLKLPAYNTPVSIRLLGLNKTIAPYYVGPLLAAGVLILFLDPYWWIEGPVLGLGAVLGDHVKSLIKRSLGYKPGAQWWLDRIDFAIGGGMAAWLYFDWVQWAHVLWIVGIAWPVHYFGNRFSYSRGWRDTPH
jgi:hypothetical protein